MSSAHVVAVCVVHAVKPDPGGHPDGTAIDKRAVDRRVHAGPAGLSGDRMIDMPDHGGRDKAVYAYAAEDQDHWAGELGVPIPPGLFGENLTTRGLDVTGAVIGERWAIGDPDSGAGAVLEVAEPRIPCATFQRHLQQPRWVRRFTEYGAPGAYCRVVVPGTVGAGDPVRLLSRPAHGVTIGEAFRPRLADPDRLLLLLQEPDLAPMLATELRRTLTAVGAL